MPSRALFTAILFDHTRVIFQSTIPLDEIVATWVHGIACQEATHITRLTREDDSVLYLHPMAIMGFDTKVVRLS